MRVTALIGGSMKNKTAAPEDGGLQTRQNASALRRAGADLLLLARILDVIDLAELLLVQLAVFALHDLDQILVHDDVAGGGIDRDRAARAVVFPCLQRIERRRGVGDLAFG